MRRTTSRRAAVSRIFTGIFGTILGVSCNLPDARADDESVRTIGGPSAPHRFGDRGDVVLPIFGAFFGGGFAGGFGGGSAGGLTGYSLGAFSFTHDSSVQSFERQESTTFSFAPNLDFFVARHLSLGGTIGVGYANFKSTPVAGAPADTPGFDDGEVNVSIAPRVGYVVSLGDHVAMWPRISVGAGVVDGLGGTGPMPVNLGASADLQFVYSIDRRFYVAVGPTLAVYGNPKYGIYESSFGTALSGAFQTGFVL